MNSGARVCVLDCLRVSIELRKIDEFATLLNFRIFQVVYWTLSIDILESGLLLLIIEIYLDLFGWILEILKS